MTVVELYPMGYSEGPASGQTETFSVATPADWRLGEPVIVAAPGSCGVAKERMEDEEAGVTCVDWFFCTEEISEEQINAALLTG